MKVDVTLVTLIVLWLETLSVVMANGKVPSAQALPVRGGMHRHVVLITTVVRKSGGTRKRQSSEKEKHLEFLGSGSVLNTRWILTASIVLKNESTPRDIFIAAGYRNRVDQFQRKYAVEKISKYLEYKDAEQIPEHRTLALLKTAEEMKFDMVLGDVLLSEQPFRQYQHCELVGYYYEQATERYIKTQMPVQFFTDNCSYTGYTEICLKVVFQDPHKIVNPCVEKKVNLGAPIMCDIGLEAVFYGYGAGKGCTMDKEGLRAFVVGDHSSTKEWLFETVRADLPTPPELHDYYYEMFGGHFDYRREFVLGFITLDPNVDVEADATRAHRPEVTPKPPKKCSKGDRWDGHLVFIVCLILLNILFD